MSIHKLVKTAFYLSLAILFKYFSLFLPHLINGGGIKLQNIIFYWVVYFENIKVFLFLTFTYLFFQFLLNFYSYFFIFNFSIWLFEYFLPLLSFLLVINYQSIFNFSSWKDLFSFFFFIFIPLFFSFIFHSLSGFLFFNQGKKGLILIKYILFYNFFHFSINLFFLLLIFYYIFKIKLISKNY